MFYERFFASTYKLIITNTISLPMTSLLSLFWFVCVYAFFAWIIRAYQFYVWVIFFFEQRETTRRKFIFIKSFSKKYVSGAHVRTHYLTTDCWMIHWVGKAHDADGNVQNIYEITCYTGELYKMCAHCTDIHVHFCIRMFRHTRTRVMDNGRVLSGTYPVVKELVRIHTQDNRQTWVWANN